MEPPSDLTAWTFDTIRDIVRAAEYEPARFDYKQTLHPTDPDPKKRDETNASLLRTACAMANSGGGLILFGIRDRRQHVAQLEDRIVGIPLDRDLRKEFGDKVQRIQPELSFDAINLPIIIPWDSTRGIFVVSIPTSLRRPHMVRPDGVFYRRGDGGSAISMDFYEVRDQMIFSSEYTRKIAMLRNELRFIRSMADGMRKRCLVDAFMARRFDTTTLNLHIWDANMFIEDDVELVMLLTEVSQRAMILNNQLNIWSPILMSANGGYGFVSELLRRLIAYIGVGADLRHLERVCLQAEHRLDRILGPLQQPVS